MRPCRLLTPTPPWAATDRDRQPRGAEGEARPRTGPQAGEALNRWAFYAKHIPGSRHYDTPDELYAAVKPDDEVVVYCSNVDCLSSVALYRDLVARGYRNVRRYSGGLLDWEDAGLPLEGTFVSAT